MITPQLAAIILGWLALIIAVPVHAFLQMRSHDNSIRWRQVFQSSIAIAACCGAVVAVGGLFDAPLASLLDGALVFGGLVLGLSVGGCVGRPIGWLISDLIRRI